MTPLTNREALLSLAERASKMGAKVKRIHGEDLSAQGMAIAIAMIVTLDLGLFDEVAASLRAIGEGL